MAGGGVAPKIVDEIVFTLAVGAEATPKGFGKEGLTLVAGSGVAPKIFDKVVFTLEKVFAGGAILNGVFDHIP